MMPLWMECVALGLLFVLSAFFSGTETALFSLSKMDRRRIEEKHPKLSVWVNNHLDNPRRTLGTLLIGNLVVNTLLTVMVTMLALEYWGPASLGGILAAFTLWLVLVGEITPKVLAVRQNELFAIVSAVPLRVFATILFPVRRLMRLVTDRILSFLVSDKKENSDLISEEELRALVKIGEEEGVLDRQERHMIQKIFELGQRSVKAIMMPRIEVVALNLADPREKLLETMRRHHFSHFPVYQNSVDHIVGTLSVQEYVLNPEAGIQSLIEQPLYVPEGKRIDDLLAEFRSKDRHFAVCVDEYGGTAGVVTLEDILEEIFGEFYDEYSNPENPVRAFGSGEFIVEAKITLEAFNESFSTHLKSKESASLGGLILEKLGEVPEKGKVLRLEELEIRIHEVIGQRRIKTVIVRKTI